jgi:AraC-like DNA-binding protein
LPKFSTLSTPAVFFENLQKLILLGGKVSAKSRLQEQAIFQEVLMYLHRDHLPKVNSSVIHVAENAADFLRQNFHQQITYDHLSEVLNFHSAYITRCMKQVYGCTPHEYLTRYRLDQSKIFLLNTDKSISEIAEKVGFSTISYFTKSFAKSLKITPLKFRHQFR